jgi:hypothetical protein
MFHSYHRAFLPGWFIIELGHSYLHDLVPINFPVPGKVDQAVEHSCDLLSCLF